MTDNTIKTFNTAGPCVATDHYMLPVLPRIPEVQDMIEGKYYFVLHAPRQSGKTTFLDFLTDKINLDGKYYAINCSLMSLRSFDDDNIAMKKIAALINKSLLSSQVMVLKEKAFIYDDLPGMKESNLKISLLLNRICEELDKELIVFFDEADCLSGPGLITFLAQIRDAYQIRHKPGNKFPRSMALIGMRDIRDYLIQVRPESDSKGLASPFNIKKEALTLANFTHDEIKTLYQQHTEASGQIFEAEAIGRAWYWSEGQPWLVNALAYEVVVKILKQDYSKTVTVEIIDQAAEALIQRRDTHIDSLMDRLKESRIRRVMEPVILGLPQWPQNVLRDDKQYVLDLGLLKVEEGVYKPANQIYQEVIIRELSHDIQDNLPYI
jgi:hypothetical protein